MKAIYDNSGIPEKAAKKRFFFPENVMMENAAAALEKALPDSGSVLVLCGAGNNGGDGYALARRIAGKRGVQVLFFGEPKTEEASLQKKMCQAVGVEMFSSETDFETIKKNDYSVIVDCIFGTGFHGELPVNVAAVINWTNSKECFRLACDVPSGLAFKAHKTITMGALKSILLKDEAKDFCGKIEVADLGISASIFESCVEPDAWLLEESDIKLPVREKQNCHKGTFGHAAVVLGGKPGAGIIAGTAALRFGAGLVSMVDNGLCQQQFFMSPELMAGDSFPEKTSAVLLGSGLGRGEKSFVLADKVVEYICGMKNPAAVFDADFFYCENLEGQLDRLNSVVDGRFVLTPHPKELEVILKACSLESREQFAKRFERLVLVAKGANTFIFAGGKVFVCAEGTNALAKAGSGDVLAGMCVGLLAQGYDAVEAAKTAVFMHGKAGEKFENNWECSPFGIIEKLC